jgi:tRNA A-37 threonylcarbamoyl transferase component Bud32
MTTALNSGIDVPRIYKVDVPNRNIIMEFIEGLKAKDWLR